MAAEGSAAWLRRGRKEQLDVLLRASANYACHGYDVGLAASQARAEARAAPPDAGTVVAAVARTRARGKGRATVQRKCVGSLRGSGGCQWLALSPL